MGLENFLLRVFTGEKGKISATEHNQSESKIISSEDKLRQDNPEYFSEDKIAFYLEHKQEIEASAKKVINKRKKTGEIDKVTREVEMSVRKEMIEKMININRED